MKTRKIRIKGISFVIFVIITFFPSCRLAYYPTSYNAPVLQKQGDTQVTGVIGLGNNEIQIAYAAFDHIGLTLTGSYFAEKKEITIEDEVREITEHFTYLEGGVGYFDQIGTFGKYGIFGGAGLGRVPADFRNSFYDGNQTSLRKKIFLQPAIGFKSKMVDVSGVLRLSAVNINKETNLFAEPGVILLMGYKNLKFYADAGISIPYRHTGSLTWDHNFFIIGFGVQLNFNILGNQNSDD